MTTLRPLLARLDHADRALDHGIVRTVWMSIDEVRASAERHRSPLVLKCIEDYAAGQRYPLDAVYADPSVLRGTGG